jgi:diguanylate cyclase (GGDEF)-like protein
VSAIASVERLAPQPGPRVGLPSVARPYLFLVLALGAAAAVVTSWTHQGHVQWVEFTALLLGGAVAQSFAVHIPANQVFHTGLAFTVAAALVLPPEAFVLVCVAQHIPEWLRQRHPWYIQSFNIANCIVSGLAAWAVREGAVRLGIDAGMGTTGGVVAAVCAGAVFVLVSHALLARMLRVARGHEVKATGLFGVDGLITDLVLAAIGIATAIALRHQPAAAPVVVFPLIVIHRAFALPSLRAQALRDHKTGLLNSRAIAKEGQSELERASRFKRPLSLLVVDVNDLRGINNRHGHLVGDAALVALAGAFRVELRDFDLCARFGGDEFLVLLPETPSKEAYEIARRIHERVSEYRLPAGGESITFGVSIGVASRHAADATLDDLIHRADAAMYKAKEGDAV